jgi:hypothetical protein
MMRRTMVFAGPAVPDFPLNLRSGVRTIESERKRGIGM